MASYRFCRPDDIPRLIEAINHCQLKSDPSWDLTFFKEQMEVKGLWPGYCMLALEGDLPIAVLLACKKGKSVEVLKIATHPKFQRQGHASHLLTSLKQKVAILMPECEMEVMLSKDRFELIQLFKVLDYKINILS